MVIVSAFESMRSDFFFFLRRCCDGSVTYVEARRLHLEVYVSEYDCRVQIFNSVEFSENFGLH